MSIQKFRSVLYRTAKALGDVQAVQQASRRRSATPLVKRVGRRVAGKATGRLLGKLFR